jgi:ATP-dependent exoDNAse (exonuclease V) beta subunit
LSRKRRQNLAANINILVITYNRTLKGYIEELAEKQVQQSNGLDLIVSTFGKWSKDLFPEEVIIENDVMEEKIRQLSANFDLISDFIVDEIDYLLGRFLPPELDSYINCKRVNRGTTPRVDKNLRVRLMKEIIYPYIEWKKEIGQVDWNDLAVKVLENEPSKEYDIIIADEAQDLSANQIRALMRCAGEPSSVIFVMDAAQRIYPRGFPLAEVGIEDMRSYRLKENHRNTREICAFAEPLLIGLDVGDDGTLPDLKSCKRSGSVPLGVCPSNC